MVLYFALTRNNSNLRGESSFFGNLLPSGEENNFAPQDQSNTPEAIGNVSENTDNDGISRLRHLTTEPTAGDAILVKEVDVIKDRVKTKEKQYWVRYSDRATGHIFDININSPTAKKISNTTIPKIYEAIFTPDGNSLIARFLSGNNTDQIITYYITLKDRAPATTTEKTSGSVIAQNNIGAKQELKETSGIYLDPDIREIALSPSGTKILLLTYAGKGSQLILSDTSGKKPRTVLSHPLREWLVSFLGETKAVLTTKPSGSTNGYAYVLDLDTGTLRKIIGEIAGLTVLPNKNNSAYLAAGTPDGTIKLFVYFNNEDEIKMLQLATFPEKCVWSNVDNDIAYCAVPNVIPNALYPDVWYQGKVSFTDNIWKINVKSGETNLVSSLSSESGQAIDGVNLRLASDDTYLTFINKTDLTLWGLNLKTSL
ncbi:MAG TPA: hypothetical protein VJH63_03540 [Candidatus Paceibacterota bacterium]